MKSTKSVIDKRQQALLKALKAHKIVYVQELAKLLNVSPITIRRDLELFESQHLVTRFYGGATAIEEALPEKSAPAQQPNQLYKDSKERIAAYAASLVETNDIIFINSSSTALLIVKYLKNKSVTVITNNGNALTMARDPLVELVLTGGEVLYGKKALVGSLAATALSKISANKAFLGISGISSSSGLTTSVLQETAIDEMMIKHCNGNCFIVADSSKVGFQHNFFSGSIELVQTLITDKQANEHELELIRGQGVEVIVI